MAFISKLWQHLPFSLKIVFMQKIDYRNSVLIRLVSLFLLNWLWRKTRSTVALVIRNLWNVKSKRCYFFHCKICQENFSIWLVPTNIYPLFPVWIFSGQCDLKAGISIERYWRSIFIEIRIRWSVGWVSSKNTAINGGRFTLRQTFGDKLRIFFCSSALSVCFFDTSLHAVEWNWCHLNFWKDNFIFFWE